MIKLFRPTKAEAQDVADACHSFLLDNDPEYADSVLSGNTVSWCVPQRNGTVGDDGVFVASSPRSWFVWVDDRVKAALPQADQDALWPPVPDHEVI